MLGPFNPSVNVFHWLEFVVEKHLPSDAHKLAGGRLAVAMTRLSDRKLIIMSDFKSREDVAQVGWKCLFCTKPEQVCSNNNNNKNVILSPGIAV